MNCLEKKASRECPHVTSWLYMYLVLVLNRITKNIYFYHLKVLSNYWMFLIKTVWACHILREKIFVISSDINSFMAGGRYHIETELCWTNQWTGFYMITASVMKELKQFKFSVLYCHRCWQKFYVFFSEQLNVKNCKLENKKLHCKFKNVIM